MGKAGSSWDAAVAGEQGFAYFNLAIRKATNEDGGAVGQSPGIALYRDSARAAG